MRVGEVFAIGDEEGDLIVGVGAEEGDGVVLNGGVLRECSAADRSSELAICMAMLASIRPLAASRRRTLIELSLARRR